MFQYTKEVIINSLIVDQDSYGSATTADKVQAEAGLLRILREGEYKAEYLVDNRINKTPGNFGTTASITFDGTGLFTEAGLYNIVINFGMLHRFLSDYANAAWKPFGKTLMAEFEVTEAEIGDMTAINNKIMDALKLVIPYNNVFAKVSIVDNKVVVNFTDSYIHVIDLELSYYEPTSCESCVGHYEPIAIPTANLVIVQNKEPFGTGKWIQENLRFPSYPNRRYAGLYSDETPIIGALYTEYTFQYDVPRKGYFGISAVNQKVESVTNHVFYVLNSLVTDFEALITEAFGDNVIVTNNSVVITSSPTIANDGVAVQLIADTYPVDSTATITWAIEGTAPEGVSITTAGQLTATSAAVLDTKFTVTATSSNAEYSPASREFTVIQG